MRKNKQKKSLHSIIMIAMLSLFVIACGGGGGGSDGDGGELGTLGNPFLVDSIEALQNIGSNEETLSAHYKQVADIDLNGVASWTPIGDDSNPFTGTYDGNNKKILELKINAPTGDFQGLFGYISGDGITTGIVKNLGFEKVKISGHYSVGGVVGYNVGTISNCYITGDVTGDRYISGVVGRNFGAVSNCYTTADVIGNNYISGVVGENRGTVENCYAMGNVSGVYCLGGVVGATYGGTVSNCYATGEVTGTGDFVGGVVGGNSGTVENCVALGCKVTLMGFSSYIGRVIGIVEYLGASDNNYARSDMGGSTSLFTTATKTHDGKDGADLAASNYYDPSWWTETAGWSFDESDVWNAPIGTTLPTLKNMPGDRTQNPTVP